MSLVPVKLRVSFPAEKGDRCTEHDFWDATFRVFGMSSTLFIDLFDLGSIFLGLLFFQFAIRHSETYETWDFGGTPCFTNRHPMSKRFFLPEDMLHDFPQWVDLPLNCRRKEVAIHLQTMQWWRRHRAIRDW